MRARPRLTAAPFPVTLPATPQAGILNNNGATLTITNSTIANNTAGNNGGGILHNGTAMSLSFVTLSGNSANTNGFGIGHGDQIANFAAGTTVKSSQWRR